MRVLITGGAGFIGANLAARFVAADHGVVVLDDLSTGAATNLAGLPVEFHEDSVLSATALHRAARGVDAIVHLAAIPSVPRSIAAPLPSHEVNATGTVQVLEAARIHGTHVTVASSSSVYGDNPELPKRETMVCSPQSPYAVSKLAAESYAAAWRRTYDVPTLALRFFNVYGPLQAANHAYAAVIPSFLDAALHGRPLTIHGDGHQTRDFTYVDSVTALLARAAEERVVSDVPVNLAFGSRRSLIEVVAELEALLGHRVERVHAPPRTGDVRDSQADNGLLRGLFPAAQATEFRVGLKATLDWMSSSMRR